MRNGVKLSNAGSVVTPAFAGVHAYENGFLPEFILAGARAGTTLELLT